MLATPCPQCGKPAPLSLAHPDEMTCVSCGHRDRPRPEIAQELHVASAALAELDARHRQLTAAQRSRIGGRMAMIQYGVVSVMASGLAFVFASRITVVPGIVILAQALVMLFVIRAGAATFARKLAAVSGGAKPGCRVCGSDLDVTPNDPVARCHYCAADNLVTGDAMTRAGRQRVLTNFPGQVATAAALPGR